MTTGQTGLPGRGLPHRIVLRTGRVLGFGVYFAWEFVRANLTVLWEILRPRGRSAPAIVAVPLQSRTSQEIVSLANLLTLTPGTLALEVALDPPTLYVHGMFADDPDQFVADLQQLERRMLTAFRPVDQG